MSTNSNHQLGASGSRLRLFDAVAQSVGFMGPVFSIAFLVPLVMGITSVTGKGAGVAAPLAVLLAAIGVLGFGWIVSQYARRIHAAGALYDYVTEGLGKRIGGAAGFLYYSGVLALGAAILVILGGTIHDTLAGEFGHAILPEIGWYVVLLIVVGATVFYGVALSTRLQLFLAMISIIAVLMFCIYVIFKTGDQQVGKAFSVSGSSHGWGGIMFGVLYGVLLFTGFESAAQLGEETENPSRDIPRALLLTILGVSGFYILATYAQIAGFGFDLNAMGEAAGAPLFALASPAEAGGYGSVFVVRLMETVVILDMLAVLLGCATAGSRGLFALARDGRLPSGLAKISAKRNPLVAGIVVMVLYAVAALITEYWASLWAIPGLPHYIGVFTALSTYGSFGMAAVYFLLSLGSLRGLKDSAPMGKVVAASVVGMLVTGAALFGALYQAPSSALKGNVVALVVFLIGLVIVGKTSAHPLGGDDFEGLSDSEHGPVKL